MTAETPAAGLDAEGLAILPSHMEERQLNALRDSIFDGEGAGTRCLLDHPLVVEVACLLLNHLVASGHVAEDAVAIQAIAFDKTAATNWKVAWHQDLMFPFAERVTNPGFDLPSVKGGVNYARPPLEVLEHLLAARLHLDDCGPENGPLRVSPRTHRLGIIPAAEAIRRVDEHGQTSCLASKGEVLLMKPLALHASSQAINPDHRRVLHYVFHSGPPTAEPWHRAITGSCRNGLPMP